MSVILMTTCIILATFSTYVQSPFLKVRKLTPTIFNPFTSSILMYMYCGIRIINLYPMKNNFLN